MSQPLFRKSDIKWSLIGLFIFAPTFAYDAFICCFGIVWVGGTDRDVMTWPVFLLTLPVAIFMNILSMRIIDRETQKSETKDKLTK